LICYDYVVLLKFGYFSAVDDSLISSPLFD